MNERIEKLAEQAMAKAVAKNFTGDKLELRMPSEAWVKEFAELIMQDAFQHLTNIGQDYAREQLERYFGVEE